MVKMIPQRDTSLSKLGSGIPPRAWRGPPRDMVRLEYSRLRAFLAARCRWRLLAMARPIDPRPYC
jgi:hypothetical protein